MGLNTYGDNAFQPGQVSDTYVPDQLIAGNLKLVTETVILTGGPYKRGQVLGMKSAQSLTAQAAPANTGTGTIGALATSAGRQIGAYVVKAKTATTFSVTDPEGTALPDAAAGAAYNQHGLAFTITAGGTAFVAGDTFTITVEEAAGQYTSCVKTASDGSQTPTAILVDDADGSAGPVEAGAYLMGEFNARRVKYDASWTLPLLRAALRASGIFLHATVSADDPT